MSSNLTTFTSYWGNALQGIWIKWTPSSFTTAGAVDASTTMAMDFDIRMYSTGYQGVETSNSLNKATVAYWKTIDYSNSAHELTRFWMLFENPLDEVEYAAMTTKN